MTAAAHPKLFVALHATDLPGRGLLLYCAAHTLYAEISQ